MSRYEKVLPNGEQVAWGYDRPLSEYFIQKFDKKGETIWSIANYNTLEPHPDHPQKIRYSNSELLEYYEQYELPQNHINALCLDIPF